MQELPINGQNWMALTLLTPGSRLNAIFETPVPADGASGGFQINVDGQQVTQTLGYGFGQPRYSREAVAELELSGRFDASQGRASGAQLNAITKSGTNTYRGGAWEYHRNDSLNGMTIFATSKPYMNRNQFGANLGGPVRRNQTFFFFNYEGLRFNQEEILLFNPPTAAMRAGDFSRDRFGNPQTAIIYDPVTQQPFPGNQIPASRFDPLALKVLSFVPLPNQPDGVYNKLIKRQTTGDQVSLKIDHKLNQANTVGVRWYRDYASAPVAVNATNIEQFYTRIGNEVNT